MKHFFHNFSLAATLMAAISILPVSAAYAEPGDGTITGKVCDSTSSPVSFASVALLKAADSSLFTGVITDNLGKFQFNNIPYGRYSLRITFVGYKPVTLNNLEVSEQNKRIDLREMKLVEDLKSLEEAVIVGQRLKGEEKVDRTVFTLNDDIRKASTTALDALKHIPSVTVDFQNNVALEGQSNIQFYVDGVLRNKEYIAQIKPGMIDKIELITNPGVKYDADVSGVINIVLKKEARYGISGSVKFPLPHPQKILAEPSANLEYGNQRFRFYIADQLHYEQFTGSELLTTRVQNSNPYYYEKSGEGTNSWQNNYMNYGIDWFINDRTSLNFMGEWRNWKGVADDYQTDSKLFTGNTLNEFLKTEMNSLDKSDNFYFSLFFSRKFKKEGNELKAEGYYNRQTGKDENQFADVYIDPEDLITVMGNLDRTDLTENLRNNGELKLDLTFMLKNVKNEAGIRTYGAWMDNDFTSRYTIEEVTNEQKDAFSYQEARQTAYYNLSGKIKKFSWQTGVRGEYSWFDINTDATADYMVLLPQVSFSQSLPKEQSLKFTYRKQIFRPSINSLNPFETWTDSLHMRRGNPDLEPAIENRLELTFTKNFKSNYLSPKIYLRYTTNGMQDLTTVTGDGITLITQENIGKNMEYGLGLNGAFQIMKRWRFNANFSVFNRVIQTDEAVTGHKKEEKMSYRFNFSHIVTLPKDYTFFLFANYGSHSISYQREFSRNLLMLVGAEKKFSEKLSADVMYNPFIKDFMYNRVITSSPDYRETWEGHVDVGQLFTFSVTYSFNRGKKISKIDRAVEYERNEGKGGL